MGEPNPPIRSVIVASGTGAAGIKQVNISTTGPTGPVQWPQWTQATTQGFPGNLPTVQATNSLVAGLESIVMPNYSGGSIVSPAWALPGVVAVINMLPTAGGTGIANTQFWAVNALQGITGSTNAAAAPDGSTNAVIVTPTTANTVHYFAIPPIPRAGVTLTHRLTFDAAPNGYSRVFLKGQDNSGTNGVRIGVDLAGLTLYQGPTLTGAGFSTAGATASCTGIGGGYCRTYFDMVFSGTTMMEWLFAVDGNTGQAAPTISFAGDGVSGIKFWQANVLPSIAWQVLTSKLFDDFTNPNTVDVNNTQAPGFNWYTHLGWPNSTPYTTVNGVTAANTWTNVTGTQTGCSVSNSLLTFQAPPSGNAFYFVSTVSAGVGPTGTFVGQAFSGVRYMEASMAFNPATAQVSDLTWPSIWSFDMGFLLGATATWEEHDTIEMIPTGSGTINAQSTSHEWQINTNNATNTTYTIAQNLTPTGSTFTVQNRYGTLIIPASKNTVNTTGLNQIYLNGVYVADQVYAAGATFSAGDNQACPFFLGAGPSWPVSFDFARVFTTS